MNILTSRSAECKTFRGQEYCILKIKQCYFCLSLIIAVAVLFTVISAFSLWHMIVPINLLPLNLISHLRAVLIFYSVLLTCILPVYRAEVMALHAYEAKQHDDTPAAVPVRETE